MQFEPKKVLKNMILAFGRIHLVLNKTLMDDTSVKRAQIKTFFVQSNFVETHGYYNFTKFQQNWIKHKKDFSVPV